MSNSPIEDDVYGDNSPLNLIGQFTSTPEKNTSVDGFTIPIIMDQLTNWDGLNQSAHHIWSVGGGKGDVLYLYRSELEKKGINVTGANIIDFSNEQLQIATALFANDPAFNVSINQGNMLTFPFKDLEKATIVDMTFALRYASGPGLEAVSLKLPANIKAQLIDEHSNLDITERIAAKYYLLDRVLENMAAKSIMIINATTADPATKPGALQFAINGIKSVRNYTTKYGWNNAKLLFSKPSIDFISKLETPEVKAFHDKGDYYNSEKDLLVLAQLLNNKKVGNSILSVTLDLDIPGFGTLVIKKNPVFEG